jgi:hypothetical protein
MTSQQYLLDQAEHCRKKAQGIVDRFIAAELERLATDFEAKAQLARGRDRSSAV